MLYEWLAQKRSGAERETAKTRLAAVREALGRREDSRAEELVRQRRDGRTDELSE